CRRAAARFAPAFRAASILADQAVVGAARADRQHLVTRRRRWRNSDTDMDPLRACRIFPDQLVDAKRHEVLLDKLANLFGIAEPGNRDVRCAAVHMCAVGGAAYCRIELRRAEARRDDDWVLTTELADPFQR